MTQSAYLRARENILKALMTFVLLSAMVEMAISLKYEACLPI